MCILLSLATEVAPNARQTQNALKGSLVAHQAPLFPGTGAGLDERAQLSL